MLATVPATTQTAYHDGQGLLCHSQPLDNTPSIRQSLVYLLKCVHKKARTRRRRPFTSEMEAGGGATEHCSRYNSQSYSSVDDSTQTSTELATISLDNPAGRFASQIAMCGFNWITSLSIKSLSARDNC